MDDASFWARVNGIMDARRNPLDDAAVTDHLARHPELLDGFADLVAAVESWSTPTATRATTPRRIAAIAGIVLLGVGLSIGGWHVANPSAAEPDLVLPDLSEDGRVLGYSSRSYTLGPDGQVEHRVEAFRVAIHEREVRARVQPGVSTPHGHSIRTELSHVSSRVRPEFTTN
jgi:hypothetical protein